MTRSETLRKRDPFNARSECAGGAGKSVPGTPNTGGWASGRAEAKEITSNPPPPWMPDVTSLGTLHLLPWHQVPWKGGVGSRVRYIVLED